jgi:hypothetical protein
MGVSAEGRSNATGQVDRGCHFAAWQEPALFTAEVRAAFRSLR